MIVTGVGGAGKSEAVNLLLEWLDARGIETHAMSEPTDEERHRPPDVAVLAGSARRGRMAIFFGAWYAGPHPRPRLRARSSRPEFDQALDRIVEFERMLHREGVLLVKFWLHLSRDGQKKRLKQLEDDPRHALAGHQAGLEAVPSTTTPTAAPASTSLRRTGTAEAPWHYRGGGRPAVLQPDRGEALLEALRAASTGPMRSRPRRRRSRSRSSPPGDERHQPPRHGRWRWTGRPTRAIAPTRRASSASSSSGSRKARRSLILVFEGPDAAGKGGAIRRLTAAMDARDYQVISVAAPTDEERAHPYLWRFWRDLPPHGTGHDLRPLLVRPRAGRAGRGVRPARPVAAGLRGDQRLRGATGRLRHDRGEVLAGDHARTSSSAGSRPGRRRRYKQYKLTAEDWRNRDRWDAYEAAACEMIEKTGTEIAPWVLVEADNKEWARVKVLQNVVRRMKSALS